MKRAIGILVTLLIGCATGVVVRDFVAPVRAQGQAGPSYEYDAVMVGNSVENDKVALLRYGAQGWRLVAATQDGPWRTLYFERQLPAR